MLTSYTLICHVNDVTYSLRISDSNVYTCVQQFILCNFTCDNLWSKRMQKEKSQMYFRHWFMAECTSLHRNTTEACTTQNTFI